MIKTITGALRAVRQAADPEQLNVTAAKLSRVAWNDGGEIRNAIERRRSELLAASRKPRGVPRKPRDPEASCCRCDAAPATITEWAPLATGSAAFYPYCSHCWHVPGPNAPSPAERTGVDALRVYDNGGKSIDRYTVVGIDNETDNDNMKSMLGLSPGGRAFSQFCWGHEGRHLGKRVPFASLDDDTRAHVLSRIAP